VTFQLHGVVMVILCVRGPLEVKWKEQQGWIADKETYCSYYKHCFAAAVLCKLLSCPILVMCGLHSMVESRLSNLDGTKGQLDNQKCQIIQKTDKYQFTL
jgi:uncharacterized membrane protein